MKTFIEKQNILERIKICKNLKNDADLARFLGISPATLSNWKSRGSIDYDLVFSKCEHVNLDWLLAGRGEMRTNYQSATESDMQSQSHVETWESNTTVTELKERITELKDRVSELKDMIAVKDELIAIMREQMRMKQWQDTHPGAPDVNTAAVG